MAALDEQPRHARQARVAAKAKAAPDNRPSRAFIVGKLLFNDNALSNGKGSARPGRGRAASDRRLGREPAGAPDQRGFRLRPPAEMIV